VSSAAFLPVARFGKRDANHDFEWLHGRDTIPQEIAGICQYLARAANDQRVAVSAAVALPDGIWLARAFHQGVDASYRSSYALEVGTLHGSGPLDAAAMLGAARRAVLDDGWPSGAGAQGEVTVEIPPTHEPQIEPSVDQLHRARLGLPLCAATTGEALAILRRCPERLRGVAMAPRLRDGAVPWDRALASLLAVHFDLPQLDGEESALLAHLTEQPPTEDEWQALDRLDAGAIRTALLWATTAAPPFPSTADDRLEAWLVAWRRRELRGLPLLTALRQDLAITALPPEQLRQALPELSPRAIEILAAQGPADGTAIDDATLEELATAGLLGDGSPVPPRAWLSAALDAVAERPVAQPVLVAGRERLQAAGASAAAADWLLARSTSATPPAVGEAVRGLTVARELELAIPLPRLWQLAARMPAASGQETLAEVTRLFGISGTTVEAFLRNGSLPPAGSLAPGDLAQAFAVRRRLAGSPDVSTVLVELLAQDRSEEARAILAAGNDGTLPRLPDTVAAIIKARLAGDPPVLVTMDASLLPFARRGLLRPGDVVPQGEMTHFMGVAAMWSATAPLAAMLRGQPEAPPAEACPPGWLAALRQVLTREWVQGWLESWKGSDPSPGRRWLCETLDLPAGVRCLAGAPVPAGAEDVVPLGETLSWIAALWQSDTLESRLAVVAAMAAEGSLEGADEAAARFVHGLLRQAEPELRELSIHLLSGRGPLPPIARISPSHLAVLVTVADPLPFVDALFSALGSTFTDAPVLVESLVSRVEQAGVTCPPHGYTAAQRERHAPLACGLARLPGWERVGLDTATRRRIVGRLLRELGLDAEHHEALAAEPGGDILTQREI
jgi:hypothetical protein